MIFLRITKVSGKRLEFVTEQARLRTSPQRRNDQGGRVGAAVRGRPARQALLPRSQLREAVRRQASLRFSKRDNYVPGANKQN